MKCDICQKDEPRYLQNVGTNEKPVMVCRQCANKLSSDDCMNCKICDCKKPGVIPEHKVDTVLKKSIELLINNNGECIGVELDCESCAANDLHGGPCGDGQTTYENRIGVNKIIYAYVKSL